MRFSGLEADVSVEDFDVGDGIVSSFQVVANFDSILDLAPQLNTGFIMLECVRALALEALGVVADYFVDTTYLRRLSTSLSDTPSRTALRIRYGIYTLRVDF